MPGKNCQSLATWQEAINAVYPGVTNHQGFSCGQLVPDDCLMDRLVSFSVGTEN